MFVVVFGGFDICLVLGDFVDVVKMLIVEVCLGVDVVWLVVGDLFMVDVVISEVNVVVCIYLYIEIVFGLVVSSVVLIYVGLLLGLLYIVVDVCIDFENIDWDVLVVVFGLLIL